jgi:hypothetical protein
MQRTKADSTRTFLHWSAPIMVGHFHHRRMASVLGCQSSTGLSPICTSVTDPVNLLPIAGLVALVKGFPKLAESIITLPLAIIGDRHLCSLSQSGHGQCIADAGRRLEASVSDQCRAARASGSPWC